MTHLQFCTSDEDIPKHCRQRATEECEVALMAVYRRFICVRDTKARLTHNATFQHECACFPPCSDVNYDVTYSLSKWPAESFDGEEAYLDIFESENYPARFENDDAKNALYSEYFSRENRRQAMRDFVRLNVYIADSHVLKTEESEDYSQSQLLSNIGGQLGTLP